VAGAGVGVRFEAEFAFGGDAGRVAAVVAFGSDFFGGLGAFRPAVLEPKPNFCRVVASILPLEFSPLAD
jgi:hypothetical protein